MKYREDGNSVKLHLRIKPILKEKLERYSILKNQSVSLTIEQIVEKFIESEGL